MNRANVYESPVWKIFLGADKVGLTHLFFDGDKYFSAQSIASSNSSVIELAKKWLKIYFAGKEPNFTPPLHVTGTTFQMSVFEALLKIPYGTTTTYGALAKELGTSGRAVGNAVARNPISLIIPCHRVIGSNGDLTGYAGGLDKKIKLLELEKILPKEV